MKDTDTLSPWSHYTSYKQFLITYITYSISCKSDSIPNLCYLSIKEKRNRGINPPILTGVSTTPDVCCASACKSICGESSTILCTDIWINSSNESSCCRTRPFSSKYELMTIQHASCQRSAVISSPSSSVSYTTSAEGKRKINKLKFSFYTMNDIY